MWGINGVLLWMGGKGKKVVAKVEMNFKGLKLFLGSLENVNFKDYGILLAGPGGEATRSGD